MTVFTVAVAASLVFTSTTSFCGLCHLHEQDIAVYQDSAHKDVNCEQCHSKPGPFFFLTAKLEALQEPVKFLNKHYEKPILASVQNAACRRCHTNDKLFPTISRNGINMNHEHLIEAGYLCLECHATVAHGEAVPAGSRTYPAMDQCLVCHNNNYRAADGKVATSRCDLCHTQPGYAAKPSSHDDEWLETHGSKGILTTCSACHPKDDGVAGYKYHKYPTLPGYRPPEALNCVDCHGGTRHGGILMPHPDDWLKLHGAAEQKLGRATCLECHDEPGYCEGCHKVRLPHPRGWLGRHNVVAARDAGACFTCHDTDNCQACHEAHGAGRPPAHGFLDGKVRQWTPSPSPSPAGSD